MFYIDLTNFERNGGSFNFRADYIINKLYMK